MNPNTRTGYNFQEHGMKSTDPIPSGIYSQILSTVSPMTFQASFLFSTKCTKREKHIYFIMNSLETKSNIGTWIIYLRIDVPIDKHLPDFHQERWPNLPWTWMCLCFSKDPLPFSKEFWVHKYLMINKL